MKTPLKLIAAACSAGALLGCASNQKVAEPTIIPSMKVQHSYESADGYYALGRYHHGARRFDQARRAYQQALGLDPNHAKAANALAVLYAETGEFQHAAELLKKLIDAAPDASHLFSNLGYVYFLKGDYQAARASLEKATTLDPGNANAWSNLGSVLEKLGDAERSRTVLSNARAIAQGGSATAAEPAAARLAQAAAQDTRSHAAQGSEPRTEITPVGSGVYEVRLAGLPRGAALPDTVAAQRIPEKTLPSAPMPAHVRIEVSNGNGVNGMAKSVGKIIGGADLKVVRLTNQDRFAVPATRIEYREGYEQSARALAERLGQPVSIKATGLRAGTDMRLVLGRDMRDVNVVRARYQEGIRVAGAERVDAP